MARDSIRPRRELKPTGGPVIAQVEAEASDRRPGRRRSMIHQALLHRAPDFIR
jgi:hypothetical protein